MKQNMVCLLVDDDHDDQEFFSDAINEVAPEVECIIASNGADALNLLLQEKIQPDYIFLDINMPKMNGCEFLESIKKINALKNIPVVVHSTSARPKEMEHLIKLGAFGIHLKEYDYNTICTMLRKYLPEYRPFV